MLCGVGNAAREKKRGKSLTWLNSEEKPARTKVQETLPDSRGSSRGNSHGNSRGNLRGGGASQAPVLRQVHLALPSYCQCQQLRFSLLIPPRLCLLQVSVKSCLVRQSSPALFLRTDNTVQSARFVSSSTALRHRITLKFSETGRPFDLASLGFSCGHSILAGPRSWSGKV